MNAGVPTIVHLDADAFFVSVELALQPEYRGKKVAVGGSGRRGIIASASYEARAAGVYTPMPTLCAMRTCPDLVLLPHRGSYGAVSRRMFDLCETLTPLVQRNSIDEGYLDIGPCGFRTKAGAVAAVRALRQRIWDELQIPVSIGIAGNKLVAQIASKLNKPQGFEVVDVGGEAAFLAPLDIGCLPGVGPKTKKRLVAQGIRKVADILSCSAGTLERAFGRDWHWARLLAMGIDDSAVSAEKEAAKSYSQQVTFPEDVMDFESVERTTKGMVDELMRKLRADGKCARTISVGVRYPDFRENAMSRSLGEATDLEQGVYPLVSELLKRAWKRSCPLRLVSVKLAGLEERSRQMELFEGLDERLSDTKRRRLAAVLDRLNAHAHNCVQRGHQL